MTRTLTLCTVSLTLAAAGFAAQAHADARAPAISFHPAKPWEVAASGPDGVCGLGSEFNNGYTVRFFGANKAPRSLDIDFLQDAFIAGKAYDTALTVPGNPATKVSARATSASTLSLNISGERDFFKALASASVLDINVEGNDFRFFMTGFTGAAQSFEQCLNAVYKPQTPAQTSVQSAAAAPAAAVNESIALEEHEKSGQAPQPVASQPAVPLMEITAENRAPVVQPMAVTEKIKLGDREITEAEAQALQTSPVARKRMSEELAAKIARNPELVETRSADTDNPEPSLPEESLKEPPFVREKLAQESPQTKSRAEISADEELKMAETPPQTAPSSSKKEEPIKPADALFAKDELTAAATHEATTHENAPAPVKTANANPDQTVIYNGKAIRLSDLPVPSSPPKAAATRPEPAAAAPAPVATPVAAIEPPAPTAEGVQKKTPDMIVRKETAHMEADFTDVGLDEGKTRKDRPPEERSFFGEPSKIEPASNLLAASPVPASARDPELIRKISELESSLADLKKENISLNQELKSSLTESRQEAISISSDNWNLERATTRYNEAERELKRLGQLLQQERAQCSVEKQGLETQLFDPRVTSQEQLAHLAELEQKLMAAQTRIQELESLRAKMR